MTRKLAINLLVPVIGWMGGMIFAGGLYGQDSLPDGGLLSLFAGALFLGISVSRSVIQSKLP